MILNSLVTKIKAEEKLFSLLCQACEDTLGWRAVRQAESSGLTRGPWLWSPAALSGDPRKSQALSNPGFLTGRITIQTALAGRRLRPEARRCRWSASQGPAPRASLNDPRQRCQKRHEKVVNRIPAPRATPHPKRVTRVTSL